MDSAAGETYCDIILFIDVAGVVLKYSKTPAVDTTSQLHLARGLGYAFAWLIVRIRYIKLIPVIRSLVPIAALLLETEGANGRAMTSVDWKVTTRSDL
jgi:hypothetical protein